MQIDLSSPAWADPDHMWVRCGTSLVPADPANRHYRDIIASGVAITDYAPPPPTWDDIRARRDAALAACDWTVLPDAPLTAAAQSAWQSYRQVLRNLPQLYATPEAIEWPNPPEVTP